MRNAYICDVPSFRCALPSISTLFHAFLNLECQNKQKVDPLRFVHNGGNKHLQYMRSTNRNTKLQIYLSPF